MKTLRLLFALALIAPVHAEQAEVYQVVETGIPKEERPGDRNAPTNWLSPGKRIAAIDTGDRTLRGTMEFYAEDSWKAEPFYGPVEKFIFKDPAGKCYIIHFEYLEGHAVFGKGMRFAINELNEVPGKKGRFLGDPYTGSSVFDEKILQRLRELVKKPVAEPAPAR